MEPKSASNKKEILRVVDRANGDFKYVGAGGPEPTNQSQLQESAKAQVLGKAAKFDF